MTDLPLTIEWLGDRIRIVDQRLLPGELRLVELTTVDDLCVSISTLAIRGAPALGAAGAMGVALAAMRNEDLGEAATRIKATRPTAVNLAWGVDRALAAADPVREALAVAAEDLDANRAIGRHGAALIGPGARVLTHCNAGALACVGYGTALGVVRAAHDAGTDLHVWVDETRPLLQGARITAFELGRLGVPHTLLPDSASGSLFAAGHIDLVIVGADRIAANGDVANKVGTYPLAVLARHHDVPFYVAAPMSTVDPDTRTGADIVIEQRDPREVTEIASAQPGAGSPAERGLGHHEPQRVAPVGVPVYNPAFDVTPAALVTAYISERGVHPSVRSLLGP